MTAPVTVAGVAQEPTSQHSRSMLLRQRPRADLGITTEYLTSSFTSCPAHARKRGGRTGARGYRVQEGKKKKDMLLYIDLRARLHSPSFPFFHRRWPASVVPTRVNFIHLFSQMWSLLRETIGHVEVARRSPGRREGTSDS